MRRGGEATWSQKQIAAEGTRAPAGWGRKDPRRDPQPPGLSRPPDLK